MRGSFSIGKELGKARTGRRKKIKIITETEIDHCYYECPYFGIEIRPWPTMVCNNPDAKSTDIISHPQCDTGFPAKCPAKKVLYINKKK